MSATLTYLHRTPSAVHAGSSDPFLFRRIHTWWLILALFLIAQANGLFSQQAEHYSVKAVQHTDESGAFLFLTLTWVLICAVFISRHIGPTMRTMLSQKTMLAFAVLAFISTFWSQVPVITFRKAVLLFALFALGWCFAAYYSPPDQMRIMLALGMVVAVTSIAMAILLPQFGISGNGEWKGVFGHKNQLGITTFYLFAALPFRGIKSRRRLLTLTFQSMLAIGLILLSRSMTALIMSVVLLAVRVLGPQLTRMRRESMPFALYGVGAAIVTLIASVGVIVPLLDRSSTIAWRNRTWSVLLDFAIRHLWVGYGYQAFWTGASGDSGSVVHMLGAGQSVADNGYLDVFLQFGVLGIVLLLSLLIVCLHDFRTLLRRPAVPLLAYWYLGLILATFVGSLTTSLFWDLPGQFVTFTLVFSYAGLKRLTGAHDTNHHTYTFQ